MKQIHNLYKLLILFCATFLAQNAVAQVSDNKYNIVAKTISATRYSSNAFNNASRAYDGNESTYATATAQTARLDFNLKGETLTAIQFFSDNGQNETRPETLRVYASDNTSFTSSNLVQTFTFGRINHRETVYLSTPITKNYIRLEFVSSNSRRRVQINEIYLYSPEGDVSIKHKRSKWFDIAESLGLPNSSLGTFSYDKPWFTSVMSNNPDAKLQAAHTYIDTIYVHKGSTVNLSLPTQMSGNYSVHTYQRWYSYRTDGTFETNHSSGSAYDLLTPTSGSAYRLSNGYVGNPLGDKMTSMNFYYPEDDEFNSWFDNAASFDNDWYVVACDVSGYTDFWEKYPGAQDDVDVSNATLSQRFSSNGYYEPTLALRAVFYIVGVDGHKSTDNWNNGHDRLKDVHYQGGGIAEDKKYLEEYDITFPAKHLSNHTSELVALSKNANGYAIPDVSETASLSIQVVNNNAGLQLETTQLSGDNRIIKFRKQGVGTNTPWEVADGSTATILVTKSAGGKIYNIARYNLTFKADALPLTQTQVSQLGTSDAQGKSWNYTYRSPQWMKDNLELLTSLNFDYDPDVASMYGQDHYFPFPMDWGHSSYAFFDGSKKGDFTGATQIKEQYFTEWGYYAIVDDYMGYGELNGNLSALPPKGVGKDDDGYFLFIDTSDRPGIIARLPFEDRLCAGSELFTTAWIKSSGTSSNDDAAVMFTIMGVKNNPDGTVTYTPIYRHSSSQIRTTTLLTAGDPGTGSGHNEWYQVYFSFINNDPNVANYDSYMLQIENNSASTSGGDMYIDDIRVYLMHPNAEVNQLDATCVGDRTLMNVKIDWERLMSRMGYDDTSNGVDAIDFCFIDKIKYDNYLVANPGKYAEAIDASVVEVGNNEDPEQGGYNEKYNTLNFKLPFVDNIEYNENKHPNLAADTYDDSKYYFYRTTDSETGLRSLVVDFYSALTPNRPYVMLINIHDNSDLTLDAEDFAAVINDQCAIMTDFYVTSETLLRVNGEVVDPSTDFCAGQIFNFSAQMRVPIPKEDGTEDYIIIDNGVYFDWFFGTEEEFIAPNQKHGGESLQSALTTFRDIYIDKEDLSGVTAGEHDAIDGQKTTLKQEQIDIIAEYLNDQTGGGLHNRLVLHKENLDIALLQDGLRLVIQPIQTLVPPAEGGISEEQWANVCWSYIPLILHTDGDAPQLHAGFNTVKYPNDAFNPGLRIGLSQINSTSADKPITIDLRGAVLVTEGTDHIGMVKSLTPDVFGKIYLVATDDPAYNKFFTTDFSEYSLPIGVLNSLFAEPYKEGSSYKDNMEIYFDTQSEQSNGFKFEPKEGYTYTFAVHFEELSSSGGNISNACFGKFTVDMKVVPENLVWSGADATSNWNNDANWKRADKSVLKKAADDSYLTNEANTTEKGFVPMLFSNVVMPEGSKAELYMAGYGDGGAWTNSSRPDYMELPTENIQYDLMAYEKDGALTTQRYRVNICRDIHFELGAQMLHAEQLLYNKAWTDVEVTPGQWTAVSTPLQGVVAGDWYAPTATGRQETEYFKDITFNENDYSRLNPAVYQRSWSTGASIVENGGGTTPVSFTTEWSSAYNDASVPYVAGGGFSIKGVLKDAKSLLFRFPKADESYDVSTTEEDKSVDRTNAGKLLVTGLLDRSNPLKYNPQNDVTTTLTPSADGKYLMVGNPFMAPLDVQAFVESNSDVLAQKYWIGDMSEDNAVAFTENGWSAQTSLIAPYSVFYVEALGHETEAETIYDANVTVKFTAAMQKFETTSTGEGSQTVSLKITAEDAEGSSSAAVRYAASASNGFGMEDAQMISGLTGNADNAPKVYTVAGNTAVSVNQLKDAQRIPLGVTAADGSVVTLTFSGVAAVKDAAIYDAELQSETPLYEGYQLTVNGPSYGRYFLIGHGSGTTGITETGAEGNVSVSSIVPRQVVVTSDTALRSVSVWSAGGALLKKVSPNGNFTCTLNGVDSGMVVVRTETESGSQVTKIRVR